MPVEPIDLLFARGNASLLRDVVLDGRRIVNYIQWQNRELLQSAHQSPDFRKAWGKFDDLTDQIDPHLYEVAQVLVAR